MESETETQLLITGITDEQLDTAERESYAQAAVIQALKRVAPQRRPAVMEAVMLLVEADQKLPGLIDMFARRRRRKPEGDGA
jgi:hypothetical protein